MHRLTITISRAARKRLAYGAFMGVIAAVVVLPFPAAVGNEKAAISTTPAPAIQALPLSDVRDAGHDGVLYVHFKLMEVAISGSGAPVFRFVPCRHYPREHKKLVQIGMTPDGHAVLRFVPGDYCLFRSTPPVTGAPAISSVSIRAVTPARPAFSEAPSSWNGGFNEHLTPNQQYACEKFGPACAVALAVQFAENPQGACEVYHYNSVDGTLDWGYFQINTVHLKRRGLNLRDLLDCKANIDFAYQLYREKGFEPWTTYVSGAYGKYLFHNAFRRSTMLAAERKLAPTLFASSIPED